MLQVNRAAISATLPEGVVGGGSVVEGGAATEPATPAPLQPDASLDDAALRHAAAKASPACVRVVSETIAGGMLLPSRRADRRRRDAAPERMTRNARVG